ncbi:Glutaredoxin [Hondaea fermentalgiana]|uniref:Glutaredoxin n=1 Tax=Hondaea fermentalgiana TaxID=2315210 RepID=A0A2R5H0S8_9STRA|nr:Glutaredoxin [Hondaea fermentalgiana]|eukprot:GBG33924.1 Glutaredoxin [Hondaea fermentalgiana]
MLAATTLRATAARQVRVAPRGVATRTLSSASARAKVARAIESNDGVLMYSKSFCSFSHGAKEVFRSAGVDVTVHELDEEPDGVEVQKALFEETGQRTVPNIFIGKAHVGGYSELMEGVKDGHVHDLLEVVGIKSSLGSVR